MQPSEPPPPADFPEETGTVKGLVDGIVAPNPGPLTLQGTRTWLIGEDRLLIVDPGPVERSHRDAIVDAVAAADPVGIAAYSTPISVRSSASSVSGEGVSGS